MMKTNFIKLFGLLAIAMFFAECEKDYYTKQREAESEELREYIDTNYAGLEPTPSGLYYIEEIEGTGRQPEMGDTVKIHYEATFLNGTVFRTTEGAKPRGIRSLGTPDTDCPIGVHEAILKMKEGGESTAILPSSLAYGRYGSGVVPSYTAVIFKIKFLSIEKRSPEI